MKNKNKFLILVALVLLISLATTTHTFAADPATVTEDAVDEPKAMPSALAIGLAAGPAAIAMGMAISKAADSISRQPEAEGPIRTTLMLGLVFIETLVIYALIVAILIIFVL